MVLKLPWTGQRCRSHGPLPPNTGTKSIEKIHKHSGFHGELFKERKNNEQRHTETNDEKKFGRGKKVWIFNPADRKCKNLH